MSELALLSEAAVEVTAEARGYEVIKLLSKQTGRNIPDLLALARQNDPFCAGSETQRQQAEWFAELWQRFGYTRGVHLRRVHYQHVSQEHPTKHDGVPYENTEGCWGYLCNAGKYARYLGMVPADAFEDHRNPVPRLQEFAQPSDTEPACHVDTDFLSFGLPTIDTDIDWDLSFGLPAPAVEGYEYSYADQPYLLEVWVEKSTMNDVLIGVCEQAHANLVTSAGFQSITAAVNLLQRVRRSGRPARVFYISDFDPAGDGMPVAVARQLEFWLEEYAPGADVKLTPIALTREQVIAYRLPRIPVKDSDRRKGRFEDLYGEGAVELDALEALHSGVLARIVRDAMAPYQDTNLPQALHDVRSEARQAAEEAWEEATRDEREALEEVEEQAREIVGAYKERLEGLNEELQGCLEPLKERLKPLRQAIQAAAEVFEVDLPHRPEPEAEPGDETEWLFDSGREYLQQLAVYRARKGKSE